MYNFFQYFYLKFTIPHMFIKIWFQMFYATVQLITMFSILKIKYYNIAFQISYSY